MFCIEVAEHRFLIKNRGSYIEKLCQDYLVETADMEISVTDKEIAVENQSGEVQSPAYLESLAVYRKICERLLDEDIILFHCSALAMDGKAYLFTAPAVRAKAPTPGSGGNGLVSR